MSACETWVYRCNALRGGLSKGSEPIFTRVSEKTRKNSERLGQQAQPEFEPGISRLPVLSATTPPLVGHRYVESQLGVSVENFKVVAYFNMKVAP